MSWARLDDQLNTNRKLAEIDNDAYAVWVSGIVHCAQHLTDGLLTKAEVALLCRLRNVSNADSNAVTNALVTAGLWEEVENGYRVHDYLTYNPSREQVLRERDSTRSRQERFRQAKKTARLPHDNEERNGVSNAVTNAPVTPAPYPVPVPLDPLVTHVTNGADAPSDKSIREQKAEILNQLLVAKGNRQKVGLLQRACTLSLGASTDIEGGLLAKLAGEMGAGELCKLIFSCGLNYDGIDSAAAYLVASVQNHVAGRKNGRLNGVSNNHGSRTVDKSAVRGSPSTLADDFRAKQAREEAAKASAG